MFPTSTPPTIAERLLCLRLTSGVCIMGAVGAAICAATGGTAPSIIALSALMTQAAAYGINRLSARADHAHSDIGRQADELTRGLRNADVHRLMGRAVSLVLRVKAHEGTGHDPEGTPWTRLAAAIDSRWGEIDSGTLPAELQEAHVAAYFSMAPEHIKSQAVLDIALWREVLQPVANEAGVRLTDADWRRVGSALTSDYPRALYAVTKTAAVNNDPAWPGLLLRLLSEQRQVMDFIAGEAGGARRQAERNTEHLRDIKDTLASITEALAQLGDLGAARIEELLSAVESRHDARADALRSLVCREGQRLRQGLAFVWTLAGRAEEHSRAALAGLDRLILMAERLPAMERTLDDISRGVAALQKGTLNAGSLTARNNLTATRIVANRFFTGRADDLARVRNVLVAEGGAVVIALTGEGGIGKSELAKAYAMIFAGEYDGVWWIDASAEALPTSLSRVYELTTGQVVPEKTPPERVAQALADHWSKQRPLIVLDNVDDAEHFTVLGPLPHGHVLATTREHPRTHAGVKALPVDVLPLSDAVALMKKEIGDHRPMPRDTDLLSLAEELGGHALAVALVGAYLAGSPGVSPANALARIRAGGVGEAEARDEGERADPLGLKYRHSVAASLSLHFARPEISAALPLLASAAFLHPAGMPLDLLAAGAGWTVEQASRAAKVLDRASIVRNGETLAVHRLTQGIARARPDIAGGENAAVIFDRLIHALSQLFAEGELAKDVGMLSAGVIQAEAVLGTADSDMFRSKHAICAARLRSHLASHLSTVGDNDRARKHIDASIAWYETRDRPRLDELAIRYEVRALVREGQCDFAGSIEDIRKSIEWIESRATPQSVRLARCYEVSARVRHISGDLAGAEADIRTCIATAKGGEETPCEASVSAYALLGLILQDMGDLAQAEDTINDLVSRTVTQGACTTESGAISLATRARIRQLRGRLAEAESDIQGCLEWANQSTGLDTRLHSKWFKMRSWIRQQRGLLLEAKDDMDRAMAWELSRPQPNAVELAVHRAGLGRILADQGRLLDGLTGYEDALVS